MVRKHALYIAICAASAAFSFAHILPEIYPVRVLWYYPLERRWAFELHPSDLAMGWYGRCLLATAVAGAVGLASLLLVRLRSGVTTQHRAFPSCEPKPSSHGTSM